MRWAELVAAAGIDSPAPEADVDILGLSRDHRQVTPGDLFLCRRGQTFDSHDVLDEAFDRGAVAALVERDVDQAGPVWKVTADEVGVICSALHGHPSHRLNVYGVTGTDGKTTTAWFAAGLLRAVGVDAASLGTLGVWRGGDLLPWSHTTPEPEVLQAALARLHEDGVTDVVMEVSSHGLSGHRVDGIRFAGVALTTLGRDHLDTYGDIVAYHAAKERLFTLQPDPSRQVRPTAHPGRAACLAGRDLTVDEVVPGRLRVRSGRHESETTSSISGRHNLDNLATALGLLSRRHDIDTLVTGLPDLTLPPGRWQWIGDGERRAVVDYAHTPAALETLLKSVRDQTRSRLVLCFGCGGGRDPGKRSEMGRLAASLADVVIVTDDNPRHEDPATIRQAILGAVPGGIEIADRRDAIREAVGMLDDGDVLVVAGKGHEQGQHCGADVRPFCDATEVRAALKETARVA